MVRVDPVGSLRVSSAAPLRAQGGPEKPFPDPRTLNELQRTPVEELPQPQNTGRMVLDVQIDGNKDVPLEQIAPLIRNAPGRALDGTIVQEDIRRLNRTRKFINVRTEYKQTPQGLIVVYHVVERPRIHYVKYIGNKEIKRRKLEKETGLKPGQPLDPYTIDEARRKMVEYYHKHGRNQVRITVLEGSKPGDQGAVFVINEGPQQKVWNVKFVGNKIASGDRLKTQIESKHPFMWLFGGDLDREKIDGDVQRLTAYYRSLGFFRAASDASCASTKTRTGSP